MVIPPFLMGPAHRITGAGIKIGVKSGPKIAGRIKSALGVGKKSRRSNNPKNTISVTKDGVALPSGGKYKIPEKYVPNPHRKGSFGEVVGGKFKERLRIDPATRPGFKGPNYPHYHLNGGGRHFSPRLGDKDPGF